MLRNWFRTLNILLAILSGLFIVCAIFLSVSLSKDIEKPAVVASKIPLPVRSFLQPADNYKLTETPFLKLAFNPAALQLPDLRTKLIYYGRNSRPDAAQEETLFHFDFQGNNNPQAVRPGKPIYLCYDPSKKQCSYTFSPENKESSLWFTAESTSKGASVSLRMKGERGVVALPENYAQFDLEEKERPRFGAQPWQMGKWRVDGSLFARQRARWYGKDQFLEEFGGDEYAHLKDKQRIDFAAEGEESYSVYVGLNEMLIWDENRWQAVTESKRSVGKPLLVINKIEERIMNCDLWDPDGKQKLRLNLLKSMESWIPQNLERQFRFVGAHTRSQYAFELNKQRMILSPDDWLLHTTEGWVKLDTLEQIDKYVNRVLSGTLFVFEGIGNDGQQQVIEGRMFNASRTEGREMQIPIQKAMAGLQGAVSNQPGVVKASDDDEDDDEEDDEDDDEFPEPYREIDGIMID
jgi:hypothetical protein